MPVDIAALAAQAKNRNLAAQVGNQGKKIQAMGGKPKKGGPSILSRIFDVVSRPMYGVMEPIARLSEHAGPENPRKGKNVLADVVTGLAGGLAGKNKTDFGEVLLRSAEAAPNTLLSKPIRENRFNIRAGGGLVGSIGLDPLTYTGVGVLAKAGKAGAKAAGIKAVEKTLTQADVAEHLSKVGKQAVAAKSAELAESGGKALTKKQLNKVARKAVEEESLKIGRPAYDEAFKAATTEAPGKVQLKFGVGRNKKVLAESEKLYGVFSKGAEAAGKTKAGASLAKKFSTKALLPEDLRSIARRRAQAGVKGAEAHVKEFRENELIKNLHDEDAKLISHAIEQGNQEIPEHLREFVTSTEKRAAADVAKSIISPKVAKAAGIARTAADPVEAVTAVRDARQHLGKMIENIDDAVSSQGWQDWVKLEKSTPKHIWDEASRLDKEVYQSKRGVQGVVEDLPKGEQPFGPEDIVPGSGGGRPSRTFSEIAKGPAKTKTVEEVTGVAPTPKPVEAAPTPKAPEPLKPDTAAAREEVVTLHQMGAMSDADYAAQIARLDELDGIIKTAPSDMKRVAQSEVANIRNATAARTPVQEAADKAQASLNQIVEKVKQTPAKPLSKAATKRQEKAQKAAREAADNLKSVEKRITNHEKIIKDLEESIAKNTEIVARAESKGIIDEVVQTHIDNLKITDGPLKGKTVKQAEELIDDLNAKIKSTKDISAREQLIKRRKIIEGYVNKAKESVVGPKVKKVLSEKEKVALDKAKAALKEDKPLLQEMKGSLKTLHGKKKELSELAASATPKKTALESVTEFLQGGKGIKELPVGTRRTEIGAMHGPPVPEGALQGPPIPAGTKGVLPQVAKQAEKVPEVVKQGEKITDTAKKSLDLQAARKAEFERLSQVAPTPAPKPPGPLHGPIGPESGPFAPSNVEKVAKILEDVAPVDDLTIPSMKNVVDSARPYRSTLHGVKGRHGQDLGEVVDYVRGMMRELGELEVQHGLFRDVLDSKGNVVLKAEDLLKDDYVYHYYHKGGKAATKFKQHRKKILGGDIPTYTKERKFVTLEAAKKAGLKPEEDIRNIVSLRIGKHYQSMARRQFVLDAVGQYGQKLTSPAAKSIAKEQGLVELKLNGVPGLKNTYVPEKIATSLQAIEKAYENPQYADDFIRLFDRVQSHWKFSATALNPGHHTRNMVGDMWNSYIGGVTDPRNWGLSGRIMKDTENGGRNITTHVGEMKLNGADLWAQNVRSGAAPGFFSAEFGAEFTAKPHAVKRKIVEWGEKREEFTRFGYFIGALKQEGAHIKASWSPAKQAAELEKAANRAADRTRKWLVDYGDLTEFESKVMKRVVPFYTWSRKNIPLQIEALFMSPGRIATIPKAQTALQRVLGTDSGYNEYGFENLPKWLKEMAPIRLTGEDDEGHTMFGVPALPFQDISKFTEGGKQGILQSIVSQITPAAKIPIEQATGEQLFSGAPIKSDFEYFAGQVPVGRVGVKAATGKIKKTDLINYLTGAGIHDVGPEQVASELRRQQDPLQSQIRDLRAKYRKKLGVG